MIEKEISIRCPSEEETRDDVPKQEKVTPAKNIYIHDITLDEANEAARDEIETSRSPVGNDDEKANRDFHHRMSSGIVVARSKSSENQTEMDTSMTTLEQREPQQVTSPRNDAAATPTRPSESSSPSKLQEMMLQRIESIDAIRSLVQNELEQDSALIAEFTEQVAHLEKQLVNKDNEINDLNQTKDQMQQAINDLKSKIEERQEEFTTRTTQVQTLSNENTRLEKELQSISAVASSIPPLKARNTQMEQIISSLTSSLKDAKICLEKELKYTASLEKERSHSAENTAKLTSQHEYEIDQYKKRLTQEVQSQATLWKEMDELRKRLAEESLNSTKLSSLQFKLDAAEETIHRLNVEKEGLIDDMAVVKGEKEELKVKKKEMGDPIKMLQRELEVLRKKLGVAEMENEKMVTLQARLDETEQALSNVLSEKNDLRAALGEQLSFEINSSFSNDAQEAATAAAAQWQSQKASYEQKIRDSEHALVLLDKENKELHAKLNAKENTPQPPNKEVKLAAQISLLNSIHYQEKKKLMSRQKELEGLLIEALKERFGGESNEGILKRLGEVQLEIVGRKNVVAE